MKRKSGRMDTKVMDGERMEKCSPLDEDEREGDSECTWLLPKQVGIFEMNTGRE